MFETLKHGDLLKKAALESENEIADFHRNIDEISERNEWRVLESYRKHKVSDTHFTPSTGYGYDDIGGIRSRRFMPMSSEEAGLSDRRSSQVHMRFQSLYSVFSVQATNFSISRESRTTHSKKSSVSEEKKTPAL